jgi:hypothetical protein
MHSKMKMIGTSTSETMTSSLDNAILAVLMGYCTGQSRPGAATKIESTALIGTLLCFANTRAALRQQASQIETAAVHI